MGFKTKVTSWMEACTKQASSLHPRARIIGIVDYYNEELEEIGEEHRCWRHHRERDDAFRHRIALTVQEKILHLEATLARLVDKPAWEE